MSTKFIQQAFKEQDTQSHTRDTSVETVICCKKQVHQVLNELDDAYDARNLVIDQRNKMTKHASELRNKIKTLENRPNHKPMELPMTDKGRKISAQELTKQWEVMWQSVQYK